MVSALLNQWHIQCIHPELHTDRQKSRYIASVNVALSQIWDVEDDELYQPVDFKSVPAMLEVEEVSNCQTAYRGASKNAVRVSSLKLHDCEKFPADNSCSSDSNSAPRPCPTTKLYTEQ